MATKKWPDGKYVWAVGSIGAANVSRLNGRQLARVTSAGAVPSITNNLYVGTNVNPGGNYWGGYICEALVTDGAWTSGQIQHIETYLKQKYGLGE